MVQTTTAAVDTAPGPLAPYQDSFPFSQDDWLQTPMSVQQFVIRQTEQISQLNERVDQLQGRLKRDSKNSNQPPSSDNPYKTKPKQGGKGKPGGKKGHPGHKQVLLPPTHTETVLPKICPCGNTEFPVTKPYHTHQEVELPKVALDVNHFILHEGPCPSCGLVVKAQVPAGHETGHGPEISALIAELAGVHGNSRNTIRSLLRSVWGYKVSAGAIQKVIDRASEAIKGHYDAIAGAARRSIINHIDETAWYMHGQLMWLWIMINHNVAFYMIHARRSKEAFEALIEDWAGILVSDGYGVYRKWVNLRQTCLAHLIRKAVALSESSNPEIAHFGARALAELKRLCNMAHAPPTVGEWRAFYARFIHLIFEHEGRKDPAGRLARQLVREMDCLWVFLEANGVEPTNNRAERGLRYAVMWRRRSQGTVSEKGNRWVERILSLKHTCGLRGKETYPVLVEAIECYLKGEQPDLSWIEKE